MFQPPQTASKSAIHPTADHQNSKEIFFVANEDSFYVFFSRNFGYFTYFIVI